MPTNAEQIVRIPLKQEAPITDPLHLVHKKYVDDAVRGLLWDPVKAVSTTALGAAVVDPKNLAATQNEELPEFDDVQLAVDDRLLLKDQADKTQNGIYVVTDLGSAASKWKLTRADDADETGDFRPAKTVYALPGGAVNGGLTFKQVTASAIVLGSNSIEFALAREVEYVQKYSELIEGDDAETSWEIEHKLDSVDVQVAFRNQATKAAEILGWRVVDADKIKVFCDPALETGTNIFVTVQG